MMVWAARFGKKSSFRRGTSLDERMGVPFASQEEAQSWLDEWRPAWAAQAFPAYLEQGGFVAVPGWYIVQPGLAACVGDTPEKAVKELLLYREQINRPNVFKGRRIYVFPGEVVSWEDDAWDVTAKCAFVRPTGPAKLVRRPR